MSGQASEWRGSTRPGLGERAPRAFAASLRGQTLEDHERAFLRDAQPLGVILFRRNCADPAQLRSLTDAARAAIGRDRVPILIDQEGGRVARLAPPHWPKEPSCGVIGALAERDLERGEICAHRHGLVIGGACREVGCDVVCAPVADLRLEGATSAIGDRAFSADPEIVARCAAAMARGLEDAGCAPVIKHAPGHGRALEDSHEALPRVEEAAERLAATDMAPFRALKTAPFAMTSHLLYAALDDERPATQSPIVLRRWLRREIGLEGFLFGDDLSMKALSGPIAERARRALEAGCDGVLHCNGDLDEGRALAETAPALAEDAFARLEAAMTGAPARPGPSARALLEARRERDALLEGVVASARDV